VTEAPAGGPAPAILAYWQRLRGDRLFWILLASVALLAASLLL